MGNVAPSAALPPQRFTDSYFMAGDIGRYPEHVAGEGFVAAWQGTPPFDAEALMRRGEALYDEFLAFFRPPDTPPPVRDGGPAVTTIEVQSVLRGAPARGEPFSLTAPIVYAALTGVADGVEELTVTDRHGRVEFEIENDPPVKGGFPYYRQWRATRDVVDVRRTPYVRGHLYFADLDSRIRAASEGARSLDVVLRELFARREAGERFDRAAWIDVVTTEIGPEAGAFFESVILHGATIVPAPDAFGPCFARRAAVLEHGGEAVEGFEWVRTGELSEDVCRDAT